MSRLVVQKFGGSVLVKETDYAKASGRVKHTLEDGAKVVVVVSALKGTTDRLENSARRLNREAPEETLDLLLATGELQSAAWMTLALGRLGIPAETLNPWQVGLHTDGRHGNARITRINPLPLKAALAKYAVVVVPGFLGRRDDNRVTTLGRGGSDLSAVALADTLDAEACEFFKDVPGYFSADPRHVPRARHRSQVTGTEAFELSRYGCRFLQDRAIEWAMRSQCRVRLRSLLHDDRATVLCEKPGDPHPFILAMTHCQAPGGHNHLPQPVSSLLSLVGLEIGSNKELKAGLEGHLAEERIPFTWQEPSAHRLTLAVPSSALVRAGRSIHDHFIVENRFSRKEG